MSVSSIGPFLFCKVENLIFCKGLFAPRAGQSFRDEQRRRRSQYDRGTRLAEIEDAFDQGDHAYRFHPNAFQASSPYGGFAASYYSHLPGFGSPI